VHLDESQTPAASLHASAAAVGEDGILIRGRSGAGKSSLAASLIAIGRQRGRYACLIGDDRIEIVQRNGRLLAKAHPSIRGKIELRGRGIVQELYEPAAVLRLAVDLLPVAEIARYPEPEDQEMELCGAKLPRLALPLDRSSYDCALLVMAYLQHARTF
jgi:HPr kinase/phosphorylase